MQTKRSARIAFIGGGNMARALIAGLLRLGIPAGEIRVGEREPAARAALEREFAIYTGSDNAAAIAAADLVVLAVKPQDAGEVLRSLASQLRANRSVLLSIAAGLRIADLERACPGVAIVRAMPNRPALVGAGVTGLYAPPSVSAAQRSLAEVICAAAGRTVWLRTEAEIDIVTAVSGSGPAYFFLLAEHLAQAGQSLGLEPETATLLAVQTLHGAGVLACGAATLAEQRTAVTSKGGTTEAALRALQAGGFEPLIARAVQAAAARSAELADSLSSALQSERP